MKYDITALGEILIDFTPAGADASGDLLFARKAGGAPVNLLAAVAKFGGKAAFIGKVGDDMFGSFLRGVVKSAGISDEGLVTDPVHNTTLAFVALDENGDRDFSFYRNFGADVFLERADVNTDIIKNSSVFHFGSLSLTSETAADATAYALEAAKSAGCIVTYDPNYREPLWRDRQTAIEKMKLHLDKVDIMKLSKEEMEMMFGSADGQAAEKAFSHGISIVLVTDGGNGAELYMKNAHIRMPAEKAETVDTTGAGDIFFGTFLSEWIKNKTTLSDITPEKAAEYLKRAIHIAGKSTEKRGAIASIPNE